MSVKTVIHTLHGSFVGDVVKETTEVIHIAVTKPSVGNNPAQTVETSRVTGWDMENAWFLNKIGDLKFVLGSLDDKVGGLERTFIGQSVWINRDNTIIYEVINAGPKNDWDPL